MEFRGEKRLLFINIMRNEIKRKSVHLNEKDMGMELCNYCQSLAKLNDISFNNVDQ
jgi:hypothetical protein